MLRCLLGNHVKVWDTILPHTEFAYNNSVNRTAKKTPFEAAYGHKPQYVLDLVPLPQEVCHSEDVEAFANHIWRIHEEMRAALKSSNELYKENADQRRRFKE